MIPDVIMAVGLFLIGMTFGILIPRKKKVDALLNVEEGEETDRYNFVVLIPMDDIPKRKNLNVEVIQKGKNPQR